MWVIRPLSYGMIIRYHKDPIMNYSYCRMLYSWGRDIGMNQSDKPWKPIGPYTPEMVIL